MRSISKPARVSRLVALLTVPAALVLGALPTLASPADNGQVEPTGSPAPSRTASR